MVRTQKLYILKRVDDGITVLQILNNDDGSYPTPEEVIAKMAPHVQAAIISWREIEPREEYFPGNLAFRDAWCDVTPEPKIDINIPKARDIHRDRLRAMRAEKFTALDIEMTRAFDNPSKQKDIEAKRQALRDVTQDPSIEKANTPEELMAVIPDILK